jgi:hypothetical protein
MGRFGLMALACSPNGPTVLQKVLDRTDKRLQLSTDQEALFGTFRTKALADETTFADACKANLPDRSSGRPDMLTQLKSGLAVDQARLTALNDVLPSFEALYNSLSDQQKQNLLPHRGQWGNGKGRAPMQPDASSSAPSSSAPANG